MTMIAIMFIMFVVMMFMFEAADIKKEKKKRFSKK